MEGKAISIEPNDVRAVACSAHGKAEFERLSRHLHPTKAIVAIARKMRLLGL